eukprot:scaffold103115_cov65-Phaeocystis_antarctica.AAC.1
MGSPNSLSRARVFEKDSFHRAMGRACRCGPARPLKMRSTAGVGPLDRLALPLCIRTHFAHDTGSAAGERGEGPAARLELSGPAAASCRRGPPCFPPPT